MGQRYAVIDRGTSAPMARAGRLMTWLTVLVAGTLQPAPSQAQNYRFQVEKMELQVLVQPNASARLAYDMVFRNMGDPIDIVDVGLPHDNYNLKTMSASIDGRAVRHIRKSEYIDVGVEVHLGAHQIPSGKTGTFHFECEMPDMVYADTTDAAQASLQIRPTWFDPSLQVGTTVLTILVHLPPGTAADGVRWHSDRFRYEQLVTVGRGDQEHIVALWSFPDQRLSKNNPKVGISFPRGVMDRVVTISAVGLFVKWFDENPVIKVLSLVALVIVAAVAFFRFSGGTGFVVFLLLSGLILIVAVSSVSLHLLMWPVAIGLTALGEWGRARRRAKYLPAMATVEGGGIKRGLTASQAGLLLELPLGKVLTLVIFGLLKKRVLTQVSADPLVVEVDKAFRTSRKKRRSVAADRGIVLHEYEQPFLDRLTDWSQPVAERDFSEAVGSMVRGLGGQMKGFDLSDTQEYYRRIVSRAWTEAESIGELNKREAAVERNFEWLLLDPNYHGRFDTWDRGGYHYRPTWSGPVSGGGSSAPSRPGGSQTSFGEVASSFAGWAENTAGGLASAVEPGRMGVEGLSSGLLDLGGVDRVTGEVLKSLAESSGSSGGGGGGGCACACAGCACACACAGGGR